MSGRNLLDRQLLPFADPNFGITINPECIGEARDTIVKMYGLAALPEAKPTQVVTIPCSNGDGDLALRIFIPSQEARVRPAILEIHGGGFIIGEAAINST